jgi:tetratricopeptide (TPR) repeat protein
MRKIIISIFLVLTFLCFHAISEAAADWFKKADVLWNGEKLSDPKKAIEYLNNAIRLQPDYADAYNSRGLAYYDLGKYQIAIEDFNQALLTASIDLTYLIKSYGSRGSLTLIWARIRVPFEDYNEDLRLQPI